MDEDHSEDIEEDCSESLDLPSLAKEVTDALVFFILQRSLTIHLLKEVAKDLTKVSRNVKITHVAGNSVGVAGALMGAGAIVATIATAGAALVPAASVFVAGTALNGIGMGVNVGASATEYWLNSQGMKELKVQVKRDHEALEELHRVVQIAYRRWRTWAMNDETALTEELEDMLRKIHEVRAKLEITESMALPSSGATVAGTTRSIGMGAAATWMTKVIPVALLPYETYQLTVSSIRLHANDPPKIAQEVLELAEKNEADLQDWKEILCTRRNSESRKLDSSQTEEGSLTEGANLENL